MIGTSLARSPFAGIFSLFWSFIWGVPGAFIGVPILIAFITCCEKVPGDVDCRPAVGQVFRQSRQRFNLMFNVHAKTFFQLCGFTSVTVTY